VAAVRALHEDVTPLPQVDWVSEEQHRSGMQAVLAAARKKLSLVDYVSFQTMRSHGVHGLSPSDGGGQYDSNGAPPHARVAGAKKFVNLVEPDAQDFCIRACTDPSKCNTGESTKGCRTVVPGIY
jgi:hypothetical protein